MVVGGMRAQIRADSSRRKLEAQIQRVLKKMTAAEVDELVPDKGEFDEIAQAVMAWQALLHAGRVFQKGEQVRRTLGASLIVLGTLFKYTYALGIRRGQRGAQARRKG